MLRRASEFPFFQLTPEEYLSFHISLDYYSSSSSLHSITPSMTLLKVLKGQLTGNGTYLLYILTQGQWKIVEGRCDISLLGFLL